MKTVRSVLFSFLRAVREDLNEIIFPSFIIRYMYSNIDELHDVEVYCNQSNLNQ